MTDLLIHVWNGLDSAIFLLTGGNHHQPTYLPLLYEKIETHIYTTTFILLPLGNRYSHSPFSSRFNSTFFVLLDVHTPLGRRFLSPGLYYIGRLI